jgi:guanylate kinase
LSSDNDLSLELAEDPLLIILSGPSGAGKDAVLSRLKADDSRIEGIITMTTRPRRPQEQDKVDYHFVSDAEFQRLIAEQEFLEWANVYGNWYGVPRRPVREALARGSDTIIKVDTQGVATIRKIVPDAVYVFLTTPDMEELNRRLRERRTESPFDLDLRLQTAADEFAQLSLFDYAIINRTDNIESAVSQLKAIIAAEKCRVKPRQLTL